MQIIITMLIVTTTHEMACSVLFGLSIILGLLCLVFQSSRLHLQDTL